MIPLCESEGIGLVPWSPLARGMLAGTQKRGETLRAQTDTPAHDVYNDADYAVVDRVKEIAASRGVNPAQIALAWMLSKKVVSAPIVGVTKVHHLDAVGALSIKLEADEIKRMEEIYVPHPVLGISSFRQFHPRRVLLRLPSSRGSSDWTLGDGIRAQSSPGLAAR
jgi:aryl-alcohol dehydrogenase-like predicted oxidoreductase